MVTEFNSDDVVAFKNYVFNKKDLQNERIKAIATNPLEVSVQTYLHEHLKPSDAENLLRFKEGFLQYCSAKDVPVALLAVGSSTYPLELMGKPAHYHDIDLLVLAIKEEDVQFPAKKGMYASRLVQTVKSYVTEVAKNQRYKPCYGDVLNIIEITNRKVVFAPYGRPNTELEREGFSPLHLVVEMYEPKDYEQAKCTPEEWAEIVAPLAARRISTQRRKNLPFTILHE